MRELLRKMVSMVAPFGRLERSTHSGHKDVSLKFRESLNLLRAGLRSEKVVG